MAVPLVQITGKVVLPDGTVPSSGGIACELSQPGSVLDGVISQRVATRSTATIAVDGSVSFSLVPNDAITPAGTSYLVYFWATTPSGVRSWQEVWQVASSPNPVSVGAVPRLSTAPPVSGSILGLITEAQGGTGQSSLSAGLVTITGGVSARSNAARAGDRPTPFDFGAIADGITHPLSTRYGSLAAAQAVYPFATSLTQEIDWAATQAAINTVMAMTLPRAVYAPEGQYRLTSSLQVPSAGWKMLSLVGDGRGATYFDASSLLPGSPALSALGNNYLRLLDFALIGPASPTSGTDGILTNSAVLWAEGLYVQNFYRGIYGRSLHDPSHVTGCFVTLCTFAAIRLEASANLAIRESVLANSGPAGTTGPGGNLSIDQGSGTSSSDILLDTTLVDEGGGASIDIQQADRVTVRNSRVFLSTGGYGIRIGASATNVLFDNVRVEPFDVGRIPVNTIIAAGTGHKFKNVSTNPNGGGDIADTSTDSIYENVNGRWKYPSTDASGTPGAATINKRTGTVAIAAGASSVVVTNSFVTAMSIVTAVLQAADATLTQILRVVPTAGSFTIVGNANATAAVKVAFIVQN